MSAPQSGTIVKVAELFTHGPPREGERIIFATVDGERWYEVEGKTAAVGDWLEIGETRKGRRWYPLSSTLRWLHETGANHDRVARPGR